MENNLNNLKTYSEILKELNNYKEGFENLQEALRYYIARSNRIIKQTDDKDIRIQQRGMIHVYTWILNSIGHNSFILNQRHATNITNCLFRELEFNNDGE